MAKLIRYRCLKGCVWLLLLLVVNTLQAQNNYGLVVSPVDQDSAFVVRIGLKKGFISKQQCAQYLAQLPEVLREKGFLSSSVDTVIMKDSLAIATIFFGTLVSIAQLKIAEKDLPVLAQAGLKATSLQNIPFQRYLSVQQKLLDQFENTGYPFAQIQLDSISLNNEKINAALKVSKGLFYKIDSIRVAGGAKISGNFIHHYLDIPRGSAYNQQKLAKLDQRLLELPYLQQVQPWDVTMLNTGSIVNLYLVPKKSNQVNVLAGFLPDNRQLGGGKLLFTIDANLQLKNAFGSGESVGIVWQQIQPRSPRLNLQYQQPFIFKSNFGLDFSFDLLKKDSLFLNLNAQLGLRYIISANKSTRISLQNQKTNVLAVDTFSVKMNRQLPPVADVSSVSLVVDYDFNNTNYRYNPSKGVELNIFVGVGSKKVRKNTSILQIKDPFFNYDTLYDSVKLSTYQVRVKAVASRYFSVGKQSVFKTALNAGVYESPNNFNNELFQIGGYRLLRGFDEESIYTNRYAVATFEYRYLLGLNSYFFGFTDVGYSQYKTADTRRSNQYIGAGIGLAFETKGGIFNLTYAAGKRNDLPFNIKESKIHFGYVSIF